MKDQMKPPSILSLFMLVRRRVVAMQAQSNAKSNVAHWQKEVQSREQAAIEAKLALKDALADIL